MTAAVDKQSLDHFFIGIQSASSLDTQNDGLSAVKERQIFAHRVAREAEPLALILSEPSPRSCKS